MKSPSHSVLALSEAEWVLYGPFKNQYFSEFTNFPGSAEVSFRIDGVGHVGYCMAGIFGVAFSDLR